MKLRNKLLSLAVGAVALAGLTGSAAAAPIPLTSPITLTQFIANGAVTPDGSLTFSGVSAAITSPLDQNTDHYLISFVDKSSVGAGTGFRLTGPIMAADGNGGDVTLNYTVTATGIQITDAHLFSNGSFSPDPQPGSAAGVSETLFDGANPVAQLATFGASSAGDFNGLTDSFVFPDPHTSLTVAKDISVLSIGQGSVAHISIVDQTFTVTPEPGTLLLGSAGLLGLAAIGRRRVR